MAENQKRMEITKANILYFAPCGLAGGLGGSTRLKNMLDVLGKLEVNTHLISYFPEKKFRVTRKQINNHLNVTTICVPSSSPKIFKISALVPIFIHGLKRIKKSDIILAFTPSIVSGFPALILAKIFGKPLLVDHTDIKDPYTPKFMYNSVLKNSSMVFTISQCLEEQVREIGCRNVVHVPAFIDADAFQKDVLERVKIRGKLGIDDKEIVVGYAGSFSHVEGLPFLFKAFSSLSKRYGNIKLVLLGGRNVPGSDDIPQLINELDLKERVILIPPQPYELMPKYLSAFDIACSPIIDSALFRATCPIKICEYMSMGLPTIVSAVGEISNVIENGCDGFLVKPGDEDDLERILEYVIQNLDSLQEVRKKAREKVIKNYTQEVILKKLETHLKSLVTKQT